MHDTSTISPTAELHSLQTLAADRSLPALRRLLVDERARLRALQEQTRVARASAEQDCIDARGGDPNALGTTQQDRERTLVLFLETPAPDQQLSHRLASQERVVDRLQAEIEAALDVRREVEGERLDRSIQALVDLAGTPMVAVAALPGTPATHS